MLCRCFNPFRLNDFIESLTEYSDNDEPSKVVFDMKDFPTIPFAIMGTNIPSFYGGLCLNQWEKSKKTQCLLSKDLVAE